ncbi:MAG TPA: hypothetical protein VKV34_12015 [Thermoleophilia bacterium]|nr:hypothetical protein [Thermoleophilia bacterium]
MHVDDDGVELHFEEEGTEFHTALPRAVEAWRRRSVTGLLLTGIAFGLREALEPNPDKPAIVAEIPGEPEGDKAFDVNVDTIRPAESVVLVRPWLLRDPE